MKQVVAGINYRGRLTQVIVFVTSILACFLIAQVAEAQTKPGYKTRFDTPKFASNVYKNSNKACYALHKKRTAKPKMVTLAASAHRKQKSKPMAETDGTSN